jgi:hypothetical protein
MPNTETERVAVEYVMAFERDAGRQPEDVRAKGLPYDVSSPPRKIEVKAFGGLRAVRLSRWRPVKSRQPEMIRKTSTSTW